MQTFTISGHFEADDIEDAIARLAQHFAGLAGEEGDGPLVLGLSEIRVSPRTGNLRPTASRLAARHDARYRGN